VTAEALVCQKRTRKYPNGRTGTNAGYFAHFAARDPACDLCLSAAAARVRAFNEANPESRRGARLRDYEKNRESYAERNLRSKHGLTLEDYDRLLAAQGGGCAICGSTESGGRWGGRFHIDHDHRCCPGQKSCAKCRRALLCAACNVGLGSFGDDPDRLLAAATYLLTRTDVLGAPR
jgi:hypothetical protein